MYLDIGFGMSVRTSSIIGIFDYDYASASRRTLAFLENAQREGQMVPYGSQKVLPQSFVVTTEYGMTRIYESELTPAMLQSRLL